MNNNPLPQHISNEWDIDYSNPLGKGNFSDGVYKARKLDYIINGKEIPNNGECVIKIIGKKHLDRIGLKEIEIIDRLLKLESHNENCIEIIRYYGYGFSSDGKDDNGLCYIYMEYLAEFKSLTEIIYNREEKRLNEDEIKEISGDILGALKFLYKYNIIHRDIKCENILYNQQTKQVKLIDFGISKFTQTKSSTFAGTPTHMAPESRMGNTTTKSDIWSFGCTMIEMAGGDLSITNKDGIPIIPNHLDNELINFIQLLLTKDTFFRPNAYFEDHLEEYGAYSKQTLNKKEYEILNFNDNSSKDINIPSNINWLILLNFNYQVHIFQCVPTVTILSIDQPIPASLIPPSVKHLQLRLFNETITPDIAPPTVSILELFSYNQPIRPGSIPPYILRLDIPLFNQDLEEDSLPETLICLSLGSSFEFNKYGGNLPTSLKILTCAYNFKSSLKKNNNIPRNVCVLRLPNYNQSITSKSIPETVSSLVLGSKFIHFESLANLPTSTIALGFFVKNLDKETQNIIQKFTPITVTYLNINNIQLR